MRSCVEELTLGEDQLDEVFVKMIDDHVVGFYSLERLAPDPRGALTGRPRRSPDRKDNAELDGDPDAAAHGVFDPNFEPHALRAEAIREVVMPWVSLPLRAPAPEVAVQSLAC
jgi:hypothetical protein